MLFIRFRRYRHTVGLLQRTFFRDTMKYMICITSEMILFINADPTDFLTPSYVFIQHPLDHAYSGMLRSSTPSLTFIHSLLSTSLHGFLSQTREYNNNGLAFTRAHHNISLVHRSSFTAFWPLGYISTYEQVKDAREYSLRLKYMRYRSAPILLDSRVRENHVWSAGLVPARMCFIIKYLT
jgi:hypothetical protein